MAVINKLSAKGVAALSAPGRYSDGGNLYLNIGKSGDLAGAGERRGMGRNLTRPWMFE